MRIWALKAFLDLQARANREGKADEALNAASIVLVLCSCQALTVHWEGQEIELQATKIETGEQRKELVESAVWAMQGVAGHVSACFDGEEIELWKGGGAVTGRE